MVATDDRQRELSLNEQLKIFPGDTTNLESRMQKLYVCPSGPMKNAMEQVLYIYLCIFSKVTLDPELQSYIC